MDDRIFVQIAAYRDPELIPTLRDCLAQADNPQRLRFGICWQREADEELDEFKTDAHFRIMKVAYQRGRGACWARHQTQQMYQDEPYTLQIDSHHRFTQGWDTECIRTLEQLRDKGITKPLLTSYLPLYLPDEDPDGRQQLPLRLIFNGFTPEGPFAVMPQGMDDFASLDAPEPARFLSAHFVFTLGRFCREVPYDPNLYFFGEEPSLAIRAFTQGYDLFHPHRVIAWHFYGRNDRPKHWSDHRSWAFRNERSMRRYRALIASATNESGETADLGCFGLGTQRSLRDYEHYSGLKFSLKGATEHARAGRLPPEPWIPADENTFNQLFNLHWQVDVDLNLVELPVDLADQDFWYVGAHSTQGLELVRQDLTASQVAELRRHGTYQLHFCAAEKPHTWTLWPHSPTRGWLEKVSRPCDS